MSTFDTYLERHDDSTELVVLLHGVGNSSKRLQAVREVLRGHSPRVDIYAPLLPTHRLSCTLPAEEVVIGLLNDIERIWTQRAAGVPYQSISFVGHSMGAIFARKICVIAHGLQSDKEGMVPAPFEDRFKNYEQPRAWAPYIRRLVLLAGMNRGWLPHSARDWIRTTGIEALQLLGEIGGGKQTVFAIRRGAPFLVQTRLQWLALMSRDVGKRPDLIVVQLLGTIDNEVAPDDSIDFSIDDVSNHGMLPTYYYLEVPLSGHRDIVDMSPAGPAATNKARAGRRQRFELAFAAPAETLMRHRIDRRHLQDSLPPPPDPDVEDMVFVVHGIRDKGYWTKKVARAIKLQAGPRRFESWTESYGYFAMLPFVLRFVRQRKVEWLMDRYCEARARYPKARFHYVGHSNGTYLAARALQDYQCARFSRIVFAGSVVRCDFDWNRLFDEGRVEKVLNYVATRDWVVAVFPKGLQALRRFDLGSAGHDGFEDPRIEQVKHIKGSHGAATEEEVWGDIARFVVDGTVPDASAFDNPQSRRWVAIGHASPWLLLAAAGAIVALFGWLGSRIHGAIGASDAAGAVLYSLLTIALLAIMRLILLRV